MSKLLSFPECGELTEHTVELRRRMSRFFFSASVLILLLCIISIIIIIIIIKSYYGAPQPVLRSASQHKLRLREA